MSDIPAYRPETVRTPVRQTPEPKARPAAAPKPRSTAKRRARARARAIARVVAFATIACVAFVVNGLAGSVALENARREGINAATRTREAKALQTSLQRQVASISSFDSIESWALAHGFAAPDMTVQTSQRTSRVALNR